MTKRKIKTFLRRFTQPEILKKITFVFVILLLLWNAFSLQHSLSQIDDTQKVLIDEIGSQRGERLAQDAMIQNFAKDLNETRSFLMLPVKEYNVVSDAESEIVEEEDSSTARSLLMYFDHIGNEKKYVIQIAERKTMIENVMNREEIVSLLEERDVHFQFNADVDPMMLELFNAEETLLSRFSFPVSKNEVDVFHLYNKNNFIFENQDEMFDVVHNFIQTKVDYLKEYVVDLAHKKQEIRNIVINEEVQGILQEKLFTVDEHFSEDESRYYVSIKNKSSEHILDLSLEKAFLKYGLPYIGSEEIFWTTDIEEYRKNLVESLHARTPQTKDEERIAKQKEEIEQLFQDQAYIDILSEYGMSISLPPLEEDDRYYYEIKNDVGEVVHKIAFEKGTGEIKIVNLDGTNPRNLSFFQQEEKKKTIEIPDQVPEFSNTPIQIPDTTNILFLGKHGSLVDTIMLAHIHNLKKEITLVSLPRDLFYNGRKINSVYMLFGKEEFLRQVSDITGFQVDKHILIDMYAFIEVIDHIGGIDVHLEQAVIDPSYKTFDNGKWGTMYYKAGDHHLSGKQALRLARSRHYSSDFARAERQQKIMKAIKNKAADLGFGDADTIMKILQTVLDKTETDISIKDALTYYFRYQQFDVKSGGVLSTGNILTSTYTGKLGKKEEEPCEGTEEECAKAKGAYILIPRDNNWNLIKWYIREQIGT